jgi:hypothetical protein
VASVNLAHAQDQQAPAANADTGQNPAVKAPHDNGSGQLASGHNSFTLGEAKAHIEKAGYTQVTGLTQTSDGLWQGRALRNGQPVDVALDFRGHVVTR